MMLLGHCFFQNAEAAVHFMKITDRLFNLLSVNNPHSKGFKQTLKLCNQIGWNKLIDNSIKNLLNLKTIDGTTLYYIVNKTLLLDSSQLL